MTIKLFADDTKLYYVFDNAMSPDCLQSCLSAISAWSDHWQLKLAPLKCSVVHVNSSANGYTNHNYSYHTGELIVQSASCFTELGVSMMISSDSNPILIKIVVAKASLRAKLIVKCFQSRNPKLLTKVFCVFVRPIL